MRTRILTLLVLLSFLFLLPHVSPVASQTRLHPARCSKEVLQAVKHPPKLEYECEDVDYKNLKTPVRRAALRDYLKTIERAYASPRWWNAPVDQLNTCAVIGEARDLTPAERKNFDRDDGEYDVRGDNQTRLVAITDPCIRYSYLTINAYVLRHEANRVYATQVLDAYFSRFDNSLDLDIAELDGSTLVIVETNTSDGMMPPILFTTLEAYSIDPRTHRAVPKNIFKSGNRQTNKFRYDDYLFDDEKLANQWHAPQLVRDGKLAPRFVVYKLVRRHFIRNAYVWNGSFYAPGK